MKKIVLASAAMGGAALVAFGASGTFAAFSDSATEAAANGAGTLTVSTTRVGTAQASDVSVVPGGSTATAYYITNDQSSDTTGYLSGFISVDSERENGCNRPERLAGDTTCADDQGEFGSYAQVTSYAAYRSAAECNSSLRDNPESLGVLNSRTQINGAAPLQPGQGLCVVLEVSLPSTVGNVVQGDSTNYTLNVTLNQFQQTAQS